MQFQAICNERSAIMLEYLCFDFSLFGTSEAAYSLDDYIHFIDRCDAFKEFPFRQKIARDVPRKLLIYMQKASLTET